MIIYIEKFGQILISRPAGKEAFLAFQPSLREIDEIEEVILDFEGVNVMGPSWADEFVTPLKEKYGKRLSLKNTENASIRETLKLLENVEKMPKV